MNVLIVKTSALGDIVHALPVLPFLKRAVPQMQIDWLVEEGFAPILEGHPLIRRVHRLCTKKWRCEGIARASVEVLDIMRRLKSEQYDTVLDLQGNCKSGLFSFLAGAPLRFGFDRDGIREWPNLLFTNRRAPLGKEDHHVTERSLAVARRAFPRGGGEPMSGPLPVSNDALAFVDDNLKRAGVLPRKCIALHYGTTWKTKLWPIESWRLLARLLCDELQLNLLLTWGNEDELAAALSIQEATGNRAILWPRGTLPELVALLSRVDLVVGGDTGPVHIAAAVGTPTVSLYRATDASRNAPRGALHLSFQAPQDCSPCLRRECPRDRECGASLSVQQVFNAIKSHLQHLSCSSGCMARR